LSYQDELFVKTVNNNNKEFKFKLTINDQMTFSDFSDFQEHLSQSLINSIEENIYENFKNEKNIFTKIKIEIYTPTQSDLKDDFFFNSTFYEIELSDLLSNKFSDHLPSDNILYIICSSLDNKHNLHKTLQEVKKLNFLEENFKNLLFVFTKPDRLESQRELSEIDEIFKKEDVKFLIQICFIKMRTDEERHAYPKIFDFYENYERKFYEGKFFLKSDNIKSKCGLDNIMYFISNNFINQFAKNFPFNQKLIHEKFDSCIEEMKNLGGEIPDDESSKLEILRILFRNYVIKYAGEMTNFYSNILTKFIKKNIFNTYYDDAIETNEIFDENKFGITRELNKCLQMKNLDHNIKNLLVNSNEIKNSLKNNFIAMPLFNLENLFFSISKKIIEDEKLKIQALFDANLEMNKQFLSTKIAHIFSKISSSLDDTLSEKFNELFETQKNEMMSSLNSIIDIELRSEIIQDKKFYESFLNEYKNILNKGLPSQSLSEFYVKCISQISKEKLFSITEMYCKFYSMNFYSTLNKKLLTLSIENLLTDNLLKEELLSIKEDKDNKKIRNLLKEELGVLLKICELFLKSNSLINNVINPWNPSNTSNNMNASFVSNSSSMTKGPLSNSSPELREMKNKFDKFFSRKLEEKFLIDVNDNESQLIYEESDIDLLDFIDLHDHFKFTPRNENENEIGNEYQYQNEIKTDKIDQNKIDQNIIAVDTKINLTKSPIKSGLNLECQQIDELHLLLDRNLNIALPSPLSTESTQQNISSNELNFLKSPKNVSDTSPTFNTRRQETEYVMVWDNTNEISVYNYNQNTIHQELVPYVPYEHFLEDNRYINVSSSVFIAGGLKNNDKQRLFLRLDRPKNEIVLLDNIPEPVVRHSMIYLNEQNAIVLIGGKGTRMSFMYDISNDKWENFGELKSERIDATLFLVNNFLLFCFAGVKDQLNKNEDHVLEFKCLNNLVKDNYSSNWTSLKIKCDQPDLIPKVAGICGFGTVPNNNKLLLLGGYDSDNFSDQEKAYQLKINSHNFSSENIGLVELSLEQVDICHAKDIQSWFPENNFITILKENESKEINHVCDTKEFKPSTFVNFNVDGEIVKFDLESLKIDVIPSVYEQK
jgi:hypothetical protein